MSRKRDAESCDPPVPIQFSGTGRFTLDARKMVDAHTGPDGSRSCEYNFVNLFCWEQVYKYQWFVFEGRLIIYDGKNNCLFMPLGEPLSPEVLYAVSRHLMNVMELSPHICLASPAYVEAYPDIHNFYTVTEDRDAAEYIYLAKSLMELKGNKLHKKRNLISQFKRKYPGYRVTPINTASLVTVKSFARDLLLTREPVPASLTEEFSAMEKAFGNWDALGLEGLLLTVDDNVAAFSIFSRLNRDTYNIHFEKSNIAFKGAAQVINQETAGFLADKALYINREQDLGVPGLRQAKLSYAPHHLLTHYLLTLKSAG